MKNDMSGRGVLLGLTAVALCGGSGVLAAPPAASVSGVTNVGWQPGNCEVASFGQLVQQRDPTIAPAEVVVRAGTCTQSQWVDAGNYSTLVGHPRFLEMGPRVDAARLFGLGFSVAWKPASRRPYGIASHANSLTPFTSVDEAVALLKELIAAGTPVQVHVDTAWLVHYGGTHGSHFVVVHAYDADNVYYCENGGADGTNEDIALSWSDFLAGWTEIARLDPAYPGNECFMLWLDGDPVQLGDDWILAWLARDVETTDTARAPTGPAALRAAAAAIRGGADGETAFGSWQRSLYGNWKPYLIEFLDRAGHPDWAAEFARACEIWHTIHGTLGPDWPTVCDLMDQAADIEEQVLAEMAGLADTVEPIVLTSPASGEVLSTIEGCTLRWAQMPGLPRTVVQLAMGGDFDARGAVRGFVPGKGNWFVPMTRKEWMKTIGKDDGDRACSWRVAVTGKAPYVTSEEWFGWPVQQMTSVAPAQAYRVAAGEPVTFTFELPYLAMRPCVVVSTTGDFADRTSRTTFKAPAGQSQVSLAASALAALKKKDADDGIVYWRVEDAAARTTTVRPSETRSLILP